MSRKKMLYPIFIFLIIILQLTHTVIATMGSSQQEILPLYNKTHKPVPDNLPWYPIVVFGDNRPKAIPWVELPEVFYESIKEISQINPLVTIGLGDHVGQGSERQYREFYRVMNESMLENQIYAMGNHDISYGGAAWKYWIKYMGPYTIVFDDIPGWRIAILDSEGKPEIWEKGVEDAYRNLEGRSLIVAFHRPIKPYVHHNLQDDYPEKAELFLKNLNETGQPILVLQAHWHGWAEYNEGKTTWLIVGSLGAPLYDTSDCVGTANCVSSYHYLVLILYPNQTYSYIPVKAGKGSGNLTINYINKTCVYIRNTKVTVYNESAEIPVRIEFTIRVDDKNYTIYYVTIAPYNATIYVRLTEGPSQYTILTNSTYPDSYVYIEEMGMDNGNVQVILQASSNMIDLTPYIMPEQASAVTQTTTTVTKTTSTTTKTQELTTTTTYQSTTGGEMDGGGATVTCTYKLALGVIIIALVLAGLYLLTRR